MKSIEDFDLKNMELVDRYLSGKLSAEEELHFYKRLAEDSELKEDLTLAKKYLNFQLESNYSPDTLSTLQEYKFDQIDPERKALVGKNIIADGLGTVLFAAFMVLTCALIIYLLMDK